MSGAHYATPPPPTPPPPTQSPASICVCQVEGSKPADDCRNDVEASGGIRTSQKAASKNDGLISKIESAKWEEPR